MMLKRKRPGTSRTAVFRRNKKKFQEYLKVCKNTPPIPSNLLEAAPSTPHTEFIPDVHNDVGEEDNRKHFSDDVGNRDDTNGDDGDCHTADYNDIYAYSKEESNCDNDDAYKAIGDIDDDNDGSSADDDEDSDDGSNADDDEDSDDGSKADDDDNDDDKDDEDENPFFTIDDGNGFNLPLLSNKNFTVKDNFVSIIATSMKNRLSYEGLLDIFRWIKLSHQASRLPTTKTALWNILSRNKSMISVHYYCKLCKGYLGEKNKEKLLKSVCPCKTCGPKMSEKQLGYFFNISLASQIKQLLKVPNITQSLQYRFQREKKNEEAFEDIYDGHEYKRLCLPGNFLEHWFNFSFTLNTDGCQVSNSSRASAWPVYVEINELPPHLRKKYVLLAAIYVDDKHPKMNNFLRPFTIQIRELFQKGITWKPTETTEVTSKFIVIVSSLDSPARAAVLRVTQFNGFYGCLHCYAYGKSLSRGKLVYPFNQCYGKLRTDRELRDDMKYATESGIKRHGVKGYSSLTALPLFNIHKGVIVEAMHAVFLGAAKLHTTILLKTTRAPYSIGGSHAIKTIDKTLLSIRPPSRRSRKPRMLKFYTQWKASEWRNWLDYAPVCLQSVLEEKVVNHIALLSEAVHYLNSDSITLADLDRADILLKKYIKLFEKYFGEEKMTSNIHSLTHLVDCVRNWGPIWAHNAFVFESWNKKIIDCLTSPNARLDQIATRFLMQRFINHFAFDESISNETRNYIVKKLKVVNETIRTEYRNKFVVEGTSITRSLSKEERIILHQAGYTPERLMVYQKMRLNGVKFSCVNEKKITKFSDAFIYNDTDGVFSTIEAIVQFVSHSSVVFGIIVKNYQHVNYGFRSHHIHIVKPTNTINFIQETCTIRPAIKMTAAHVTYALKLANCWETD